MAAPVLDGTAPAALVVVQHSLGCPAWPVVRELVARAAERSQSQLFISCVAAPGVLPIPTLDLAEAVPGYSEVDVEALVRSKCDERSLAGGQIVVDALDVLAEDYGSPKAVRILRCLLAAVKPGRVVLVLPPSQFLDDIVSAAVSPSAAHLTPHSPQLVETLARTYLLTGDEDKFFPILEAAAARRQGDALALNHGQGGDSIVLQVLLRKPAGGAKGITREVSGLRRAGDRWEVVGLSDVVDTALTTAAAETKSTTHADLNLPFNLSLTDQQRANRGAVPLPYAHEGEGADLSMGMDWEDEDEEDEL